MSIFCTETWEGSVILLGFKKLCFLFFNKKESSDVFKSDHNESWCHKRGKKKQKFTRNPDEIPVSCFDPLNCVLLF